MAHPMHPLDLDQKDMLHLQLQAVQAKVLPVQAHSQREDAASWKTVSVFDK
jgi:hypothetical protein